MRNIYDNSEFFAAYAEMGRSKDGLKASGISCNRYSLNYREKKFWI